MHDSLINDIKDGKLWVNNTDVLPQLFQLFCNDFSKECITKSPQSYAEAYLIISEYDKTWRVLAKDYHETFGKVIIDFDYFLNTIVPIIREHYNNPNVQEN